jgi:8-amino-7-oxononanoate synthase
MGTLSKAVGAYGGYLCTSRSVAGLIRNRARSLIYTTALPPGVLAAALKGIEIIASDSTLVAKPLANAQRFAALCALPPPQSAIVPILLETPERALEASQRLEQRGYLAVAIRPPTVPEGTARLRCAFSAMHTPEQVEGFAAAMTDVLATL